MHAELHRGKEIRLWASVCRHNRVVRQGRVQTRSILFYGEEKFRRSGGPTVPKATKKCTRPTKLIEILQTSATSEEHRPTDIPWFEIEAEHATHVNKQAELLETNPLHVWVSRFKVAPAKFELGATSCPARVGEHLNQLFDSNKSPLSI